MSGIDYGRLTPTINRDPQTGIRYGIAPMARLEHWVWDEADTIYDPACPNCGSELGDADETDSGDWACPACENTIPHDEAFGDEPSATIIDSDGVSGMIDSSGDAWCFKSPWITSGTHCSPCAPGAVTITADAYSPDGPTAYCFPANWYAEGEAPPMRAAQ